MSCKSAEVLLIVYIFAVHTSDISSFTKAETTSTTSQPQLQQPQTSRPIPPPPPPPPPINSPTAKPLTSPTTESLTTSNSITLLPPPSSSSQGSSHSTTSTPSKPVSSITKVSNTSNVDPSKSNLPAESNKDAIIIGVVVGLAILVAIIIIGVLLFRRFFKLEIRISKNEDTKCAINKENVPHVACSNDQQFDNANPQYMPLNEATRTDKKIVNINPTYVNVVLNPVEGHRSTYTALDFNNARPNFEGIQPM